MEKLLELSDIILIPSDKTYKSGRLGDMNFWVKDNFDLDQRYSTTLPIFTSPMSSVIDSDNWETWLGSGIKTVIPRTDPLESRIRLSQFTFSAFSLKEIKDNFLLKDLRDCPGQLRICMDIGNGHDVEVFDVARRLRSMYGKQVIIMGGNIANPATYVDYFNTFDYVRVGISGSSLVDKNYYGYHYPIVSLISNMKELVKGKYTSPGSNGAKIIVDGGISSFTDIIKAIAVGADYVMIGREFAKLYEAAGPIYLKGRNKDGKEVITEVMQRDGNISKNMYRLYSGNTSLESQALRAGYDNLDDWKGTRKLSDARSEWVKVERNLISWLTELKEHFQYSFLMSDSFTWDEFRRKVLIGRCS